MRAALLREIPGKLEIDEVEVSSPGPHEVLLRTVAAGLCHSDLHFMEGKYPYPTPALLGHESAGDRGGRRRPGQLRAARRPRDHLPLRVLRQLRAVPHRPPVALPGQGRTSRAPGAEPRLTHAGQEVYPLLDMGSFAERMLIHEHGLVKIREDMPLDRAALDRLRRHHRRRRRVQHRQGGARRHRRGDRVRRRRA